MGWFVLLIQAVVCQLMAWLSISFATQHMRPTRVSLSLLGQAVITSLLAWVFLDEKISLNMIIGGLILLLGIRITFYTKNPFDKKNSKKHKEHSSLILKK
jgi:drug/metabolite transporter (DMT)-like permease